MKFVYLTNLWEMDRETLNDVLTVEGTNVQYSALGAFSNGKDIKVLNSNKKPLNWLKANRFKQVAIYAHTEEKDVYVEKYIDHAGNTLWAMYPKECGTLYSVITVMLKTMKVEDVSLVFDLLKLKVPVAIGTRGYLVHTGPLTYVKRNLYVWESNS